MTTWIRVRQDGVGEWSQSIDIPLRDGQQWLRDEPSATAQGAPLPPAPDDTHMEGASAPTARTEPPEASDAETVEAGSTQPQGTPVTPAAPPEDAADPKTIRPRRATKES